MAFTPMLALDTRNGNVAAYAYTGASVSRIGEVWDVGPETSGDTAAHVMLSNRIVQFKETNQLIAVGVNQIRAYRGDGSASGAWEVVHTFVSPSSVTDRKIGPFVCYVNNAPLLVVCYLTSNVSDLEWIAVTSSDGENWTENSAHNVVHPQYDLASFYGAHVYRNVIYWWGTDGAGTRFPILISYDPATDTFTSIQPVGGVDIWNTNDLDYFATTTYNGKHYCVNINQASTSYALLEISGGGFTKIGDLYPAGDALLASVGYKNALFTDYRGPTDGQAMYALIYGDRVGDTTDGWICIEIEDTGTGTFTFTDITNSVIPTALRPSTTQKDNSRMGVFYDRANDQHLIYFSTTGDTNGQWDCYIWNGNNTLMGNNGAPNSTGGDSSHALSFGDTGSGSMTWQSDELHVVIEDRLPTSGGERIFFRLYSQTGTETVKVALYYDENDEQVLNLGTINNPSHGTINANVNEDLVADDGATLYAFTWLAGTDGFETGDPMRRQLRAFI